MARDRHVLIIGGGIIGLSCAYELACRGVRVTVLERDSIGEGASMGNAGIIAPGHMPLPQPGLSRQMLRVLLSKTNPLYIKPQLSGDLLGWLWKFWRSCSAKQLEKSLEVLGELGRVSDECFTKLHEDEGVDGEYSRVGRLEVFTTARGRESAQRAIELTKAHGFEAEELGARELLEREPAILENAQGAAFFSESGFANPGKYVEELADVVRGKGAEVLEKAKVVNLQMRESVFCGVGLADGRRIAADELVMAAGVWTTQLARSVGVSVPMQAGKGYHVELEGIEVMPKTTCVMIETYVAATPINGRLRLAGTVELSGINDQVMQKRLDILKIGARQYLRGIDEAEVVTTWNGMRPMTADGLPVIGQAPGVKGIWVATGHAMLGFMLGPGTGKVLSELMLDGETSIDVEPLRVDRF